MDRKVSNILPPIIAGLISVIVNYGGTFILIFQAAQIAGLNPEQTASWVWSISIGVGITGIILSWYTKEPIITAWSTPAAAFLVTAIATVSYSEVIAAYILSAFAFFYFRFVWIFWKINSSHSIWNCIWFISWNIATIWNFCFYKYDN